MTRYHEIQFDLFLIVFLFVMFLLIIVSFIWTYHSVSTLLAVILYSIILLIGVRDQPLASTAKKSVPSTKIGQ